MADETNLQVAQQYLQDNYPHMADGHITVTEHNPQHDIHLADHLDDIETHHFDTENYSVITSSKDIKVDQNVTIPSILKVKVQDGQVVGVLGSKSFDSRQISH